MASIGQIQVGGQTYNIVIPAGLTEEEQAQIRQNIGASGTISDVVNLIYPVGKHYIQLDGEPTPAALFPNTSWEIDTSLQGRTIIGSGGEYTFGATGGDETHRHAAGSLTTLMTVNTPSYTNWVMKLTTTGENWDANFNMDIAASGDVAKTQLNRGIQLNGETAPANIMPPYTVVNFWKRTA